MNPHIHNLPKNVKLYEIADIRLGHPFRGTIKPDEKGDVQVIQVRDTEETGEINTSRIVKTILKTKKTPDWLQNGDVLFIAKGARHHSVLVENISERTVCSPHFFMMRLKPEFKNIILPAFLCWQLNQQPVQRYFKATVEGSMYLSIRRKVLENVPIKILELEKQRQLIALHRCGVQEKKHCKN